MKTSPFNRPPVALSWERVTDYVSPHHRGGDASTITYLRDCRAYANARALRLLLREFPPTRRASSARCRFQLIPTEILPHCAAAPLGVMVRGIMESLLDAEALETLLQEYAPQQYTLELTIDALVVAHPAVRLRWPPGVSFLAAYTADQASMDQRQPSHQRPGTRRQARTHGSQTQRSHRPFPRREAEAGSGKVAPALLLILAGYRTRILDGNVLTGTDHRLTALRQWLNACLPGKSLVVLERDLGLISDLVLCEDAYTQERALLTYILERVQARDLLVFDRNFTTTRFAFGIADAAAVLRGPTASNEFARPAPSANWSSAGDGDGQDLRADRGRPTPILTMTSLLAVHSRSASSRRLAMARRQLGS